MELLGAGERAHEQCTDSTTPSAHHLCTICALLGSAGLLRLGGAKGRMAAQGSCASGGKRALLGRAGKARKDAGGTLQGEWAFGGRRARGATGKRRVGRTKVKVVQVRGLEGGGNGCMGRLWHMH